MKDAWTGTLGEEWGRFADTFSICLVTSPANRPTQMGMAERHVGLLKIGIESWIGTPGVSIWRSSIGRMRS